MIINNCPCLFCKSIRESETMELLMHGKWKHSIEEIWDDLSFTWINNPSGREIAFHSYMSDSNHQEEYDIRNLLVKEITDQMVADGWEL